MMRGRPVSTVPTWECHVHLRLRVGEDDDLIAFLSKLPPRKRTTALKAAKAQISMVRVCFSQPLST
jgi:hypothetical protein